MNTLFNHGIKQTQLLNRDLAAFEANISGLPLLLQGTISTTLSAFNKTCAEYRLLLLQAQRPGAPQIAGDFSKHEQRIAKFTQDSQEFAAKFDRLREQRETIVHESGRQELLGRRAHGSHASPENPYDADYAASLQRQSLLQREGLLEEKALLGRGAQQLDYILEMGSQALDDIVSQNQTLEKVKEKFELSLITLGVSRGTINRVNKRAREDKWLFYGGIIFMLVCFWYIVRIMR